MPHIDLTVAEAQAAVEQLIPGVPPEPISEPPTASESIADQAQYQRAAGWVQGLQELLGPLPDLGDRLSSMLATLPADELAARPELLDRAATLLGFRPPFQDLGPDASIQATLHQANTWRMEIERIHNPLHQLASRVAQLRHVGDVTVICPSDFRQVHFVTPDMGARAYAVVSLDDIIPEDHLLRQVSPADLFELSGGLKVFVLGQALELNRRYVAADTYELETAIGITQTWVLSQQRHREKAAREEAERKGQEAAQRELERQRASTLERRVAELELLLKSKKS